MKMKYSKILLCVAALICLTFQASAQDPLGAGSSGSSMGSSGDYLSPNMDKDAGSTNPDEGVSGMVQWLDQPVTQDAAKPATTETSATPSPDAVKSTATATSSSASDHDATESTTTTTSTTPATEPTSTAKSTTTTSTTPGFEATFAVAGILVVTFIALRRSP
jgi:PGF-CTERM protein